MGGACIESAEMGKLRSRNMDDSKTLTKPTENKSGWWLAILALGVVFGDIGTSPLYALRETFLGNHPIATDFQNVLGAVSLFFWSLFIIVTFKYVFLILRADNNGEGGIFSLLGLIKDYRAKIPAKIYSVSGIFILFGAALLYGDGIITPAISVLSAVEGLGIAIPSTTNLVIPLTLVILLLLFAVQKKGTAKVATYFSPIMILWFISLIGFSLPYLFKYPAVFNGVNPIHGFNFLYSHGFGAIWIIGAVVLCVTGAEALYADLGHFGRKAVTRAWLFFVYPALLINYFGQGARLLDPTPIARNNLFYSLVTDWAMLPMVILSTLATVIASQAMISGSFSLTSQAVALGVLPRVRILHTNKEIHGQIYMPFINWALFAGSAFLVMYFKNSGSLAAAYGIAVTGTMAATTIAFFLVASYKFKWSPYITWPVCGVLLAIDLIFFISNSMKFFQGGYIPIALGGVIFSIMSIWRWGRKVVGIAYKVYGDRRKMTWFIDLKRRLQHTNGIMKDGRARSLVESDRAIVFLSSHPVNNTDDGMPATMRVNLKRSGVIPKYVIILTILQEKIPFIEGNRYKIINFGSKVISVQVKFGFMENPNIKEVLRELQAKEALKAAIHRCSIEIGEEEIIINPGTPVLIKILTRIYRYLSRIAVPVHRYFGLSNVSGLEKTLVPIVIDKEGVRIDIPEFALMVEEEQKAIDPDTLAPSETKFRKIG